MVLIAVRRTAIQTAVVSVLQLRANFVACIQQLLVLQEGEGQTVHFLHQSVLLHLKHILLFSHLLTRVQLGRLVSEGIDLLQLVLHDLL